MLLTWRQSSMRGNGCFTKSVTNLCGTQKYWHVVYVLVGAYFVWPWAPYRTVRDVTPGPLSATDTYNVYHVTHFEASRNVILHTRYVSTYVGAGCGRGRGTKKTKAIRFGACYYSIVLNAHRVTSMADTDIDAVRKQNKTYTWSGTSISLAVYFLCIYKNKS
jgi:hypothetical protein